jgi:hypothetical protein
MARAIDRHCGYTHRTKTVGDQFDVIGLLMGSAAMAEQNEPISVTSDRRPIHARHLAPITLERKPSLGDIRADVVTSVPTHGATLLGLCSETAPTRDVRE